MNNKEYILNSITTIYEMLQDRKISLENVNCNSLKDIIDKTNIHKIAFPLILNEKIKILFYMSNKFKFSELKEFYKDKMHYDIEFLIINDKVSTNNQKLLHGLNKNIEIFHIKELQLNITKHALQPHFEVINSQSQIDDLMKTYNLKSKSQLPLILRTDPISKYFGLKSGDITKITRISETSGTYIYYRLCV